MRLPTLLRALLRRELATGTGAQRMLTTAAASLLAGFLAAGDATPLPRGLLGSILGDFPAVAAFTIGLVSGARLAGRLYDDPADGWLTQRFAAGLSRAGYVLQLIGATLIAAALDVLIALGGFDAAHGMAGGLSPLGGTAAVLTAAPVWLLAVLALAALAALALGDRTRARFVFVVLLLLPYLATFLFPFLHDDRPLPHAAAVVLLRGIPLWASPLTARHFAALVLYSVAALGLTILLARARLDRRA